MSPVFGLMAAAACRILNVSARPKMLWKYPTAWWKEGGSLDCYKVGWASKQSEHGKHSTIFCTPMVGWNNTQWQLRIKKILFFRKFRPTSV